MTSPSSRQALYPVTDWLQQIIGPIEHSSVRKCDMTLVQRWRFFSAIFVFYLSDSYQENNDKKGHIGPLVVNLQSRHKFCCVDMGTYSSRSKKNPGPKKVIRAVFRI